MNKNYCQHTEKIIDYRLGLLPKKDADDFEKHLGTCSICQHELRIESTIEKELSAELQPGFIENRVRARLQLGRAQDMRPFWLYVFRMAIYGATAVIVGSVVFPFLLKFPIGQLFDFSKYIDALPKLTVPTLPINPLFLVIGFCYIFVIASSIYAYSRIRY